MNHTNERASRCRAVLIRWLLAIAMMSGLPATGAASDVVAVAAPSSEAALGASVDLPFLIDTQAALGAMQFEVCLDGSLSAIKIVSGDFLRNAQGGLEFNEIEPGRVRVAMACAKPIQGRGVLFQLQGRAGGSAGDVAIHVREARAWESQTLRELRVEATSSVLAVRPTAWSLRSIPLSAWLACGIVLLIAGFYWAKKR